MFNPFLANVPILYPLKTPENQRFSGVFREHKMGILARNELRSLVEKFDKLSWTLFLSIYCIFKILLNVYDEACL